MSRWLASIVVLVAGTRVFADPPCGQWVGAVCADEEAQRETWHETLTAMAGGSVGLDGRMIAMAGRAETADIDVQAVTRGGGTAAVGLLDLEALLQAQPELQSLEVIGFCSKGFTSECSQAIQQAGPREDAIKSAALWGHGCKGATDFPHKSLVGIPLEPPPTTSLLATLGRYVVVAKAENDSLATITAQITHHSPRTTTERVCGAKRFGQMPAPGTYVQKPVGGLLIDVQPASGGTLSKIRFSGGSPSGLGTFSLSTPTPGATATLFFSGKVIECEREPSGPRKPIQPEDLPPS